MQPGRLVLEEQIRQLAALRNASTRDPGFKQWRQNTLTVIQRIWPTEPSRSERFRRVPFTPPSSQSSAAMAQEFYERGCAEAASYLKSLVREMEVLGGTGRSPEQTPSDPSARGDEPSGRSTLASRRSYFSEPELLADRLQDLRERMPTEPLGAADEPTRALDQAARGGPAATPPRQVEEPGGAGQTVHRGGPPKPALKDLLGFTDHGAPSTQSASTGGDPRRPPHDRPASVSRPESEGGFGAPHDPVGPPASGPGSPSRVPPADDPTAEFLRTSPVLSAAPKPAYRPVRPAVTSSPVSLALRALAVEVMEMGVPENRVAGVRGVLLDLGHRFDEDTLDWQALREAVEFVMEYPALARRVLPMLIPYLELEP
jgi:hypothetical protein